MKNTLYGGEKKVPNTVLRSALVHGFTRAAERSRAVERGESRVFTRAGTSGNTGSGSVGLGHTHAITARNILLLAAGVFYVIARRHELDV